MYILYAPREKFGNLPPKTALISEEVLFTQNIAYCPKFFWQRHHILQGCKDITPAWLYKMRQTRRLNNILIIATGGAGDSLWTMPFVKALREQHPRSKILIITEDRNMPLWLHTPFADLCVKDEFWNMQALIRNADEVYDFGGVATFLKKYMRLDPIEAIFKMADYPLPKQKKDCRPMLVVTIDEGKQAEALLARENIDTKTDKIITIALESSTPNRNYPFFYTRLISQQLIKDGYKIIWLSESKDFGNTFFYGCDCGWDFPITTTTPPQKFSYTCPKCGRLHNIDSMEQTAGVANLGGKTNIRQAMAIIGLSDLFIGPNSALMVIATALNIPTIGLFGAFDPKLRAKFYDRFIGLMGKPKCAPCNEHWTECKEGYPAPCMKLLAPLEVYKTALEMIKKYPRIPIEKRPIL